MLRILILFSLFYSSIIFSQEEMHIHQKNAKQAVLDFFEGFHNGDTVQIRKVIDENIVMQTIAKTKEGKIKTVKTDIRRFLEAIHNRPKEQIWLEKLLDFKVDANEGIAQIWTPYEFYVNEQFSHCGVNVFQLFNNGNTWKIIAIADTRKREGCK